MSVRLREAVEADAPGLARVHVDSWRTTYRGIVPDEHLDRLSYDRREGIWREMLQQPREAEITYVAESEAAEIIGFATGGPEREADPDYHGELYAIYILKEWQGRGVGARLTRQVATRLIDSGFGSLIVWVLAGNPSRHFYEALGGQPVRVKEITIGGALLEEVAYGWRDLRLLLAGCAGPEKGAPGAG